MRSLVVLALLLTPLSGLAESTLICDACRSPYDYPRDYGNYLYNRVFADATLSISDANQVKVSNPSGQWAMVDIDMVLSSTGLDIDGGLLGLSIYLPTGELRIKVQDPAGTMTQYDVFWNSPALDVGGEPYVSEDTSATAEPEPESTTEPTTSTTTSSNGGEYLIYTYWGMDGTWYWYYETGEFRVDVE